MVNNRFTLMVKLIPQFNLRKIRTGTVLFLSFILFLSLYKTMRTEKDPDFFWYLGDGGYVLKHKKVPEKNIYTFLPSEKWVAHSVGFDVILYFIYKNFGDKGVIVLKLFLLSILFLSVILRLYHKTERILIFLILYVTSYLLIYWGASTVRPHILTYIFSFLILFIVEKRKYFLITFILPVWSFFHAGLTAGIGISFIFALSVFLKKDFKEGLRIVTYTLLGIVLIIMINPYHLDYFLWIYNAFTKNVKIWQTYITEWETIFTPIFFDRSVYYILALSIILFNLAVFVLSKEKKEVFYVFLLLSIFYSSLKYVRNIPLFGVVSAFILPKYFESFFQFKLKFEDIEKNMIAKIILLFLSVFLFYKILFSEERLILDKKFYPVKAVEFLSKNFNKGNILCPSDRGGFIEYYLYPRFKISVDGRLSVPSSVLEEHFKFWNLEIGPFKYLKKYPVDFVVVENKNAILIETLKIKLQEIYQDRDFTIFRNTVYDSSF